MKCGMKKKTTFLFMTSVVFTIVLLSCSGATKPDDDSIVNRSRQAWFYEENNNSIAYMFDPDSTVVVWGYDKDFPVWNASLFYKTSEDVLSFGVEVFDGQGNFEGYMYFPFYTYSVSKTTLSLTAPKIKTFDLKRQSFSGQSPFGFTREDSRNSNISLIIGSEMDNPFSIDTASETISDISLKTDVIIAIFNIKGQRIRTFEYQIPHGTNLIFWNGYDDDGEPAPTGVYFYIVQGDDLFTSDVMVLIR